MTFGILPKTRIQEYEDLFRAVFNNPDVSRLDFKRKINGFGKLKPIPIVAYSNDNEIVSLLTIYPEQYCLEAKTYLGGQIGDALTVEGYRGRGIFAQLVEFAQKIAQKQGYDFLITFPSKKNKGSYSSFIKNGWKRVASVTSVTKYTKASLLPRILRKLGTNHYLNYEKTILKRLSTPTLCKGFDSSTHASGLYDSDYFESKNYNKKCILKLPSGKAYISVMAFHITLGLYELKEGCPLDQLLVELSVICQKLGKDFLDFYYTGDDPLLGKMDRIDEELLIVLIHKINPKVNFKNIKLTAADIDTF